MTLSLALHGLAAAGVLAFGTSGLVGLVLVSTRRALLRLAPVTQARLMLGLALLPLVVTTTVMAAALAPAFGWILDDCLSPGEPHGHPHLCADHEDAMPGLPLMLLAALFTVRVLVVAVRCSRAALEGLRTRRVLARAAGERLPCGARVLPFDGPQAFVLGAFRPLLFVTRGLLAPGARRHLEAVLAHERAHVRRRDGTRRLAASVGSAFHLPCVASAVERRLGLAHELVADAAAAAAVGCRLQVADAIMHLARANLTAPTAALAFAASDVELRVRALLAEPVRESASGRLALLGLAAVGLLAVAGEAAAVHHQVEVMLGALGG